MGRIIIVIAYLSLSIIANAQNKQAYLWNIGNYLFDFNTNPVTISQLPKKYLGAVWHVNQEGEILLYSSNRNFRLYDRFDKALYFNGHPLVLAVNFFVPMPDNEDLVYCFNQFEYFVVDTRTNQITSHSDQHNGTPNFITVHDYNCKNIWIIYFNSTEAIKYQITNNGLQYITKTKLITTNGNIDDPLLEKCINLSLSRDCNYFSAICPLTNEAIFGNFDRSTGQFSIEKKLDFSKFNLSALNSCISPDNSKIYYHTICSNETTNKIIEISIDDFDNYREIEKIEMTNVKREWMQFYYGIDGNIYTSFNNEIGIVTIENENTTIKRILYDAGVYSNKKTIRFISTWLSPNACNNNPCDSIEKIRFNNSIVCNGEQLYIEVPQTGPYSITYTINSNRDTTIEKINTSWQIPHIPGTYQIKTITANGCEYYPTNGNTATIGKPMKPLTIKFN